MRKLIVALAVAASTLVGGVPAMAAEPSPVVATTVRPACAPSVAVTGDVELQATYSATQLAALDQVTVPTAGGSVTGVPLESLVNLSGPRVDTGKNPQLRVTATVTGRFGGKVTFAVGELDPSFGDHPALLVTNRQGSATNLVVPADRTPFRTVTSVRSIQVEVSAVPTVAAAAAGSVRIITAHRTVTLSAAALTRLPQRTTTVSFLAGAAPQQHTETGPSLAAVLLAAKILPLPNDTVTAIGGDGYAADVTIGETLFGGRPLLLSLVEDNVPLSQPRLIPQGDVKGGRYVSGVVALTVAAPSW